MFSYMQKKNNNNGIFKKLKMKVPVLKYIPPTYKEVIFLTQQTCNIIKWKRCFAFCYYTT